MARTGILFPWPAQRGTVTMKSFRLRRPRVLKSLATWLLFKFDKYINCFGKITLRPTGLHSTLDSWPTEKPLLALFTRYRNKQYTRETKVFIRLKLKMPTSERSKLRLDLIQQKKKKKLQVKFQHQCVSPTIFPRPIMPCS